MLFLVFAFVAAQVAPRPAVVVAMDAGVCREYLWPRASDCAVKDEEATWLGDTSVGVSRVRATVKCGGTVVVCGEPVVCVCRDAGS